MEKKKEEEREQLTQQQTNKLSFHRPLSNCISIDNQVIFFLFLRLIIFVRLL